MSNAEDEALKQFQTGLRQAVEEIKRARVPDDAKVEVTLQLDADIYEAVMLDGIGWQTRINDALRKTFGVKPAP